jgi:hypothetical protein
MRGSDDPEFGQKDWKLTRKCHTTEYPDKLKQNDWDDQRLFRDKKPSQI